MGWYCVRAYLFFAFVLLFDNVTQLVSRGFRVNSELVIKIALILQVFVHRQIYTRPKFKRLCNSMKLARKEIAKINKKQTEWT